MYTKRKKINEDLTYHNIESYCNDLLESNEDVIFCIPKKFILDESTNKFNEITSSKVKVIMSSAKVNELKIPSGYNIIKEGFNYYLTTWCDKKPLVQIIHKDFVFTDSEIKGKTIKNLKLEIK